MCDPDRQDLFNNGGFSEALQAGHLREVTETIEPVTVGFAGYDGNLAVPAGSTHQMSRYVDANNVTIVRVRKWVLPDKKTLGASRQPDPKMIRLNGLKFVEPRFHHPHKDQVTNVSNLMKQMSRPQAVEVVQYALDLTRPPNTSVAETPEGSP